MGLECVECERDLRGGHDPSCSRYKRTCDYPYCDCPISNDEKLLLVLLEHCPDSNVKAVVLQSFIADNGPLSEEAGEKVRAILSN
jgi:hypothetical protein